MTQLRLRPSLAALAAALAAPALRAQATALPAAASAIRQADLSRDLHYLGGNDMRGREAGTLDEMRASMWLAEQMRQIGLKPGGEDGSWFQWWNMRRTRVSTPNSSVRLGGRELVLWQDVVPANIGSGDVAVATVWVGDGRDTTIDVRGRAAVVRLVAPPESLIRSTTNTRAFNYTRAAVGAQTAPLARRGAAAVIFVLDSMADTTLSQQATVQMRGAYDVVGGVPRFVRQPAAPRPAAAARPGFTPVLLVHQAMLPSLGTGQLLEVHLRTETFESPSVNVIGVVPGTDPALRDEYVLFGSHQDHDGVRFPVNGDSIWNGADDNASTSVALLAIARAWVRQPAKRSALFVFHGAEERGLLGSRYYVAHPTVPLDHIAAVLNGDMIGRNNPDSAALLGSQPPHRNSAELVQMALDANRMTGKFVIDSTWDRPTHLEGWYFRSDHVPYAERRVPALFFTTLLHPDYHTPRDEPDRIDYAKLERMARWMYATGWLVGNAPRRPAVDADFNLR